MKRVENAVKERSSRSEFLGYEATALIADNLKSITEKYGPASRYVHVGTAVRRHAP